MIRPKLTLPILATCALATATAHAAVSKTGDWPQESKHVTVTFEGTPADGAKSVADKAGWSLVVPSGLGGDAKVRIDVKDQPADLVLDALFSDTDVTAKRTGTLVQLSKGAAPAASPAPAASAAAPAPPAPAAPPAAASAAPTPATPAADAPPPLPTERGEDVKVTGGKLTIRKGQIVHDVSVLGGKVDIFGIVTGDLSVAGGRATIHDNARVVGDCTVLGGRIDVLDGARVDGDMGAIGGKIDRKDGAVVGGKIVSAGDDDGNVNIKIDGDEVKGKVDGPKHKKKSHGLLHDIGEAITRAAMLFVFGVVVLALGGSRMDRLRQEIVTHPAKSFAIGVVGSLAGALALLVLCVTIIGIPVALLVAILGTVGVYASIVAVLVSVAALLVGHKTKNVYAQLGFGCLLFLVASNIPWVGGFITLAVTLVAIGALVRTRFAGFVPDKTTPKATPSMV